MSPRHLLVYTSQNLGLQACTHLSYMGSGDQTQGLGPVQQKLFALSISSRLNVYLSLQFGLKKCIQSSVKQIVIKMTFWPPDLFSLETPLLPSSILQASLVARTW